MNCLKITAFTALSVSAALAQTININDNDSHIVYSRGTSPSACSGGSINWCYFSPAATDDNSDETSSNLVRSGYSGFQGASLAVTFNGTEIKFYGSKGNNYGKMYYSLDGGAQSGTLDLYDGGTTQPLTHQTLLDLSSLASGYHVLYVGALAAKNSSSSDYWLTIDSFDITGSAVSLSSGTVAGCSSSDVTFSPSSVQYPSSGSHWRWGTGNSQDLSNGHCWSNTASDSLSWTFSGNLIEVYGRPDAENGYMDVSIDGGTATRVDLGLGGTDDDAINATLVFAQHLSSSGSHTITLTVVGSNDGYCACGNYVQIDELVAFGATSSSLSSGTYHLTSGSNSVDGGFGYWGNTPAVEFWATQSTNGYQKWVWNGSTFANVSYSGYYMADNGDGTVTENTSGDTWTVTTVSGGYTVKDNRTGNYLTDNSGTLAMSGTATTWTIQ